MSKLPERRAGIVAVHEMAGVKDPMVLVKLDAPHGIDFGAIVEIKNVRGRQTVAVSSDMVGIQAAIANLIALGRKDEANKLMNANPIEIPKGDGNKHELLSCNGRWQAIPHSVDTFAIGCQLSGLFIRTGEPHCVLAPDSPVLLSDEE